MWRQGLDFQPITGLNVGSFLQVVETSDRTAYAEYRTKLEADPENRR